MQELIEQRTLNTKKYIDPSDRRKQRVSVSLAPLHWKDGENWSDIDTTPRLENGELVVDQAPYIVRAELGVPAFSYESRKGGVFTARLDGPHQPVNAEVDGNKIWYREVYPNVDIFLLLKPHKVEFYKVLKTESARRTFDWEVAETTGSELGHRKKQEGKDAKGRKIQVSNIRVNERQEDGLDKYTLRETWTGMVSKIIDPATRIRGWFNEAEYPVVIDVPDITETVTAGDRDGIATRAYTGTTNVTLSSFVNSATNGRPGRWLVGTETGTFTNIKTFTVFDSVPIPAGATITAASLILKGVTSFSGTTTIKVYGDDVDSASVPSTVAGVLDFTKTTNFGSLAVTSVSSVTTTVNDAGMRDVIQEIADRAGFSGGNIGLRVGADPYLSAIQFYEHASHNGAVLEIDYTALGGPGLRSADFRKVRYNANLRM